MNQSVCTQTVRLTIPAQQEYAMVASMTLCGAGMLAGLDVDMLGDLRTVTCECIDCLSHQAGMPESIEVSACVRQGRLQVAFHGLKRILKGQADTLGLDITRGVLETLMPQVRLQSDENGVHTIECSMPV